MLTVVDSIQRTSIQGRPSSWLNNTGRCTPSHTTRQLGHRTYTVTPLQQERLDQLTYIRTESNIHPPRTPGHPNSESKLNTTKSHITYVLYLAHWYIVSAQTHDHNTSTAHSQVHIYLSHACNNDPLVHHDHMIFICIYQHFYNTYFITIVL